MENEKKSKNQNSMKENRFVMSTLDGIILDDDSDVDELAAINEPKSERTKIKVVGIGSSGCNTVNRMIKNGISGVELWVMNTDSQILKSSGCKNIVQLGKKTTKGLGSGGNMQIGEDAAKEAEHEIKAALKDTDMVFITTGLGGGTGTGAAPVIAKIAKDLGILTVAVVSFPFTFEGEKRKKLANIGITELQKSVDAINIIQNDKVLKTADRQSSLADAFSIIDENIFRFIQSISDEIAKPGIIHVEFEHIKELMQNAGYISFGYGQASGKDRAIKATKTALENISQPSDSKKVLLMMKGSADMTLHELYDASQVINEVISGDTNFIMCDTVDNNLQDEICVTIIATSIKEN